jgi:hypothetical protein
MRVSIVVSLCVIRSAFAASSSASDLAAYNAAKGKFDTIKGAMLGSIRTSWEQGTALSAILEYSNPQFSLFGKTPFGGPGIPVDALQLAISAVARQTSDGRLSQNVGDAQDGAALDGASAGSGVLLGE